ncbi:oxidoreductase [Fusarium longipes]|uniref:Oxidoreductase n=1 Tax=Fusarium longipes TaxID=694270 RepID=A0A395SKF0_9HYPO|nr:oxidoreductase [Fusarium longipes]
MTSPKVRIAIIGTGGIGPRHARTVANSNVAILIAIVDPAASAATLAAELNVSHYLSVAELIQSPDKPDAAIISTPNFTHVALSKELADSGINILIEKPISCDVPSGKDLIQHLQGTSVKALVGHHRRFNPYMVATKKILTSGSLGQILAVNGLWALYKPPEYFDAPSGWRREKSGGPILINMVHEVDLLHYLFGPIIRVHAERTISQRGFEAEEGAALTLRFKSGIVGSFLVSDHTPSPYNFESGTGENPLIPKTGQDFYRIFGTDGSLSVPDMTQWSYKGKDNKSWHSDLVQEKGVVSHRVPFDDQLEHFVKVIKGQETPICTANTGLAALIVCEAIREALKENKTIDIEEYNLSD